MKISLRLNDLLLVVVVISSMALSIIYPDLGYPFRALPVYCLMALFFLSYLSIELRAVWEELKSHFADILLFIGLKSIILPIILFFVFDRLAPVYALSALLLTGVSTGVVATFISNLVKGNSSLVLVVVVITSALVPITLPALIQTIALTPVEISLFGMIRMLALVIFVPILTVEALRRLAPNILKSLTKNQFPISLVLFSIINLGVFYRYAPFFKKEPRVIVMACLFAVILSAIYCIIGILFFRKSSVENQLAGAVMLGNMNNVLVVVFSSQFFGPVETLVAAMYLLPFYGIVIPLRYFYRWKVGSL
jgi:BASS family bile acid:Na+ symporter